jgi:hypothetical protein
MNESTFPPTGKTRIQIHIHPRGWSDSLLRVMKNLSNVHAQSFIPVRLRTLAHTLLACVLAASLSSSAQAPVPTSPEIEAKAHAMLSKLTLEQKIELIGGVNEMFTHAIPAINLPRFKMSDASVGVRTWGPTTAYAGGVALAATWDRDFARELGQSLGKDAPCPKRQLPPRSRSQHRTLSCERPQF